MKTGITHVPLPGLPPLTGPHELAWSYVFDAVFASAYHAGVGHLEFITAGPEYDEFIRARTTRTPSTAPSTKNALAQLGGPCATAVDHTRVLTLSFGTLAPASLRSTQRGPFDGFALVDETGVYTPAAMAWGIPIRLAIVNAG